MIGYSKIVMVTQTVAEARAEVVNAIKFGGVLQRGRILLQSKVRDGRCGEARLRVVFGRDFVLTCLIGRGRVAVALVITLRAIMKPGIYFLCLVTAAMSRGTPQGRIDGCEGHKIVSGVC